MSQNTHTSQTYPKVTPAAEITGIVAISQGGTGQVTALAAVAALLETAAKTTGYILAVSAGKVPEWVSPPSPVGSPPTSTFSYSGGLVTLISYVGGRTLTFSYNVDDTVDTIVDTDPSHTKTFSYNADGTVDQVTVT